MEITQQSHNMQLSLREGKASSASTLEGHVEHPDKASLPGNDILLGRASPPSYEEIGFSPPASTTEIPGPSTSTPTDESLPPNITTDNSTGDSNHSTTQAVGSWHTQLQHLYTLLNNFRSEFNSKLEDLRTVIPLPSQKIPLEPVYPLAPTQSLNQLARDGGTVQEASKIALRLLRSDLQRLASTKVVAVAVNSPHASAGSSDDDADTDADADMQPSPSHSLMGFFEPCSSSPTEEPFKPSDHDSSSRGEQGPGSFASSSSASASSAASLGSRPGLSRVSSFSASAFLHREDLFTPTTLDGGHDTTSSFSSEDEEARRDSLAILGAVAAAAAAQDGAVRPHHNHHSHYYHHHRRQGEVIIDWQRFHAENCRESSQFSSCNACLGWRRGFERDATAAAAAWV
jgi:hypothetical protein